MIPCRIAAGHKARAGKDALCDFLKTIRNEVHVLRISEPVYELALEIKKTLVRIGYKKFYERSEDVREMMSKEVMDTITQFFTRKLSPDVMKMHFWKQHPSENEDTKLQMSIFIGILFNRASSDHSKRDTYQSEIDDLDAKCRFLLQLIGDSFRNIWENIWINILEVEKLKPLLEKEPNANIAIPDLRYKNEIPVLRMFGFRIVDINRPDRPKIENPFHSSEIDLDLWDDWDAVIDNTGTLGQYYFKIKKVLKEFNM